MFVQTKTVFGKEKTVYSVHHEWCKVVRSAQLELIKL